MKRATVSTLVTLGLFTVTALLVLSTGIVRASCLPYTYWTQPYTADSRTIGLWHIDEGSGIIVQDVSGNGHDGTTSETIWSSGQPGFGSCYCGPDSIVIPASPELDLTSGPLTVECWAKATEEQVTLFDYLICKQINKGGTDNSQYAIYTGWNSQSGLSFFMSNADGDGIVHCNWPGTNIWDGEWHHIAGTYDSDSMRLVVDGSIRATAAFSGDRYSSSEHALGIGNLLKSYTGDHTFKGCIDEVRISSIARTFELGHSVALDIKPGSCPNPLNVKPYRDTDVNDDRDAIGDALARVRPNQADKGAVLPVAILGAADFDVSDIAVTTIVLEGVSPLHCNIEDVATPVGPEAEECECNELGPDGIPDLTLKFDRYSIVQALGDVYDGDIIPLTISGELLDGTPFEGADCVVIINGVEPPPLASTFGLINYPNPFNPATRMSFSLREAGNVRLDIYNIMGQTVTTLVDEYLQSGSHEVEWNASSVASGVYLYRLSAGGMTETRRMLLLK